ncbi:Palmitoyltransferase, partial [Gryllus bimaculatus]
CLFKGSVTYEMNHNITDYNKGLKNNVACVFGKRWFISWLCPLIPSELPNDGVNWETIDDESDKNRYNCNYGDSNLQLPKNNKS